MAYCTTAHETDIAFMRNMFIADGKNANWNEYAFVLNVPSVCVCVRTRCYCHTGFMALMHICAFVRRRLSINSHHYLLMHNLRCCVRR